MAKNKTSDEKPSMRLTSLQRPHPAEIAAMRLHKIWFEIFSFTFAAVMAGGALMTIANDWRTLNSNVAAVQDRGHVLLFDPSPEEVHQRVGQWFRDEEIYAWFGRHLRVIAQPSMRHYVRAKELKRAGLDWVSMIGGQFLPPKLLLVAKLKDDLRFTTESERVEEFKRLGGGSRATYFNHAKKLRAA